MPTARNAPPESWPEFLRRALIVLAYALPLVVCGAPLWFFTTRVYRAPLPAAAIHALGAELDAVRFTVPVYVDLLNAMAPAVLQAQVKVDALIAERFPELSFFKVELRRGRGLASDTRLRLVRTGGDESVRHLPFERETEVHVSNAVAALLQVPDFMARTVVDSMFGGELARFAEVVSMRGDDNNNDNANVVPYLPDYHLAFLLLYEGGEPVAWDMQTMWQMGLRQLVHELAPVANFTVDLRVQNYARLHTVPPVDAACDCHLFRDADVSTFVNHADWNVESAPTKPTLHFVVYVPKPADGKPFEIEGSTTNAFLVPQWGAVRILNRAMTNPDSFIPAGELIPVMETFSGLLLQLLGAPETPLCPLLRIDALTRITIHKNLRSAMDNLVLLLKLADALQNISIPPVTLAHVEASLAAVRLLIAHVHDGDWVRASHWASQAVAASKAAFFEENMVQQMYFPDEHKFAVYLPLCGPIVMVTTMGVVRVFRDYRARKKTKA